MDDGELLLRAILEKPAEDTPRLIYADAIEDTDPDRAALIRAEVELARSGPVTKYNVARLAPLMFLSAQLRPRFEREWFGEFGGTVGVFDTSRGFWSAACCSTSGWLAHGPDIVARHPIERVTLSDRVPAEDHRGGDPVRMLEYIWRFRRHRWEGPGGVGPSAWDVPPQLWPHLLVAGGPRSALRYDSPDAANAALSEACLAWARSGVASRRGWG